MSPALSEARAARPSIVVGGMRIDAGTYEETVAQVIQWSRGGESRYVCIANVHMVMEARDSSAFRDVVNRADLVTSDGVPLVWLLRWRGHRAARRVYGPDLMLHVCEAAAREGVPIGLFGGSSDVLERVRKRLLTCYPTLHIPLQVAPPFGPLSAEQNEQFVQQIAESGARIVFVGLGCPKQEKMDGVPFSSAPLVLLGVGAAFNFHAGAVRQSPAWLQSLGLEWLFRLVMEPRRLWRRYVWHNPRFIWTVAVEEMLRSLGRKA